MMIPHSFSGSFRRSVLIVAALLVFLAGTVGALTLSMDSPPSSTPATSKGDPVTIRGTATGQPAGGLQVWVIGNNYAMVDAVSVNADDSFSYELKSSVTANLAQGQYFVLIQHPMMNGEFDVGYNAARGEVTSVPDGTTLFKLTGSGRLPASDAASALVGGVASQNIDDSFSAVSFVISPPTTAINPVGDHVVGDAFVIAGTTNLAAGDALMVDVVSSSFKPTSKTQSGEFTGASGTVYVQRGTGYNRWSFPVDTDAWKPDEYIVTVSAVLQDATASTTFVLREFEPVTTTPMTPATTVVPTPPATTVTAPPTTPAAAPGAFGVVAGILAFIALGYSRRNL
ncbi:MAG TPA: hypothetical protein P5217_05130 [Methanoregulaceae archaeon]|nr:hypothetical protein [Methanoregulaceae archaeon]HPD75805.1 hypothetical protein [Methanoregulaceae archaeon]HRY75647.1 hypothetical protein [Methanoregulaceae archaeon]